jgi:ubiquinone/menaquinone biosynthesis C-methylase UbiE
MSIRSRLFARYYERSMQATEAAGLAAMRANLLAEARGDVVEIGAGTGLNLPHFGTDVRTLALVEPDPSMRRRLAAAIGGRSGTRLVDASAEALPMDDDSTDVVVSALVLCGVDDQARALGEIRRILRPNGRLLLLEHVRASDPEVARRQDRLDWLQRLFAGCHCNRSTAEAVAAAGFDTSRLRSSNLPNAPTFVRPLVLGPAEVPGP